MANKNLELLYRGNTIDTTTTAKLKIATLSKNGYQKLSAPPLMVNRLAATGKNLLFVNSMLPGRFEPLVMWKQASIIDVYDTKSRTYLLSFYIHHENGEKLNLFVVSGNYLYALMGNKLLSYRLTAPLDKY